MTSYIIRCPHCGDYRIYNPQDGKPQDKRPSCFGCKRTFPFLRCQNWPVPADADAVATLQRIKQGDQDLDQGFQKAGQRRR